MPKYEVFIKSGYTGAEIEANNSEHAKEKFLDTIIDGLDVSCIDANNLDTEDGLDE